ncbi:uncharacterized protein SCHCODRAFT_02086189 [Schizophyllum commune H4-8]|uniref:uncharacterized protein n=1 Tax=Schizophyllum commune (strain H4-8 / FGSC 9210) TaxID=578458 RepID=UPI00215E4045|nr:uncharacterized protein SCHCODRAFT_02086189 [Schizophyllum commune H4-8]KAI5886980.1 hypothetical protein SCHCODRAFT_02086189 [Schizophyllum commune H4-8]
MYKLNHHVDITASSIGNSRILLGHLGTCHHEDFNPPRSDASPTHWSLGVGSALCFLTLATRPPRPSGEPDEASTINRARSSLASTFSAIFAASRATRASQRSRHLRHHTAAPVTYQSSRVVAFIARRGIHWASRRHPAARHPTVIQLAPRLSRSRFTPHKHRTDQYAYTGQRPCTNVTRSYRRPCPDSPCIDQDAFVGTEIDGVARAL